MQRSVRPRPKHSRLRSSEKLQPKRTENSQHHRHSLPVQAVAVVVVVAVVAVQQQAVVAAVAVAAVAAVHHHLPLQEVPVTVWHPPAVDHQTWISKSDKLKQIKTKHAKRNKKRITPSLPQSIKSINQSVNLSIKRKITGRRRRKKKNHLKTFSPPPLNSLTLTTFARKPYNVQRSKPSLLPRPLSFNCLLRITFLLSLSLALFVCRASDKSSHHHRIIFRCASAHNKTKELQALDCFSV